MKVAVVSFANEAGNYRKAMQRLERSLKNNLPDYKGYFFTDEKEIHPDCPLHSEVPYAFKPYAMQRAIDDGNDIIMWADSCIYATKPLKDFIREITLAGSVFFDNIGFTVGDYTSDHCLEYYGISRDEAFRMKMIMACLFGIDVTNEKGKQFFEMYKDITCYDGSWTNFEKDVSSDSRVLGHRHDQSVASIVINKLGLKVTRGQDTYFAYTSHKGVVRLADSICLWSQGM